MDEEKISDYNLNTSCEHALSNFRIDSKTFPTDNLLIDTDEDNRP